MAIDEPGNEASLDTSSTGALTLDVQPPERGEMNVSFILYAMDSGVVHDSRQNGLS